MRRARVVLVVVVVGVALWFATRTPSTPATSDTTSGGDATAAPTRSAQTTRAPDTSDGAAAVLPANTRKDPTHHPLSGTSLAGTAVDGGFTFDDQGRFVPGRDAIRLFEYFGTLRGELSDEAIEDLIEEAIERGAPPEARDEVLAFYRKYRAYQRAVAEHSERSAGDTSLAQNLTTLTSQRREIFGDEVAARIWGAGEALDAATLTRRDAVLSDGATAEERASANDAFEEALPAKLQRSRAAVRAPLEAMQAERALTEEGADADTIRQEREARLGPEAADRLASLDRKRVAWDAKLQAWRIYKSRLAADQRLGAQARDAKLQAYLERNFSPPERLRVQALERLGR